MNDIIVDLRKVQFARLHYRNQFGETRRRLPTGPSVHGQVVSDKPSAYGISEIELAKQRNVLDDWKPVLRLHVTANRTLTYTGDKARSLWEAWCARIFGQPKQQT